MIKLIVVGKMRENCLREGVSLFLERLGRYAQVRVVEVRDSRPETEAEGILKALGGDYAIVLDLSGKQYTSEEFSGLLKLSLEKDISFVIGGPEGLSKEVLDRADLKLSLSEMTFTHEMCRLFLLEQIYRGFTIIRGQKYHK